MLVRTAFWSLNGGIALMIVLSMLPIGLYQFCQNIHYGLWHARSGQTVEDPLIQNLAKMRSVGGDLFVWFCLLPYVWFICTRWFMLKEETTRKNGEDKPSSWLSWPRCGRCDGFGDDLRQSEIEMSRKDWIALFLTTTLR